MEADPYSSQPETPAQASPEPAVTAKKRVVVPVLAPANDTITSPLLMPPWGCRAKLAPLLVETSRPSLVPT